MPTETRPSGISVEARGNVTPQVSLKLRRRRLGQLPAALPAGARRAAGAAAAPLSEEEAIVDAFEGQQLDLVDAIPLAVEPLAGGARRGRRRGEAAPPAAGGEVDITVPLGPDESAVVLVERDGVYEWNLVSAEGPAPVTPAAGPRKRRRGAQPAVAAPTPVRTARFTITLPPVPAAPPGRARRGGLLKKLGVGKVVAYVFRFIAKPILGGATKFMERNVREGLVHITKTDPQTWTTLSEDSPLSLPSGRPARVLLLVHGTFSSTVGSFGALAAHDAGRHFLQAALAHYDLMIGWDHRTLSALPTENAIDLAARLERIGFNEPPQVDAIAFSRGGLVLRSLVEYILPSSPLKLAMQRAVFVACTNGGTELARPANWNRFVDRYMNLAAAGARAAALVPGFTSAGTLLASAIRGVGVFVKVLASSALTDGAVPGISAMDPGGEFVREINAAQPGQPVPHETYYCAITSNFDPDAATTKANPAVMSPTLLLKLADKAADALYGRPNDLVVHVDSMTQIDEVVGAYVRELLEFGTNGTVHHCAYFGQPDTAAALTRWLELGSTDAVTMRRGGRRVAPMGPALTGGLVVRAGSGREVAPEMYVVTLRSTLLVADALDRLEARGAPWVVVERPYNEAGRPVTLRYAYPTHLALSWLKGWQATRQATVFEAFNLHETDRSREAPTGAAAPPLALPSHATPEALNYPFGSQYRTVVMYRGQPVNVLSPAEGTVFPADMVALARPGDDLADSGTPVPAAARRRGGLRGKGNTTAAKPLSRTVPGVRTAKVKGVEDVACHFRAECDDEFVLQQVQPVEVTIAREALATTDGHKSVGDTAKVKTSKPLIVECMPMLRLALDDPDYARVEIPVPAAGQPTALRFDLVGQEAGPAEVRVQVRQGPLPLVTLTLTPTVVVARSGTRRPVKATADLAEFPEIPRATDELRIVQMRPTGGSTLYHYDLRLHSKRVQEEFYSAVMNTDPAEYVARLHERIEDRWAEHKSEKDAFARDLRAIGADLFDDLFPLELQQLLWKHRDEIKSVQVLSSEPFIPWELVHVRDPSERKAGPGAAFLGEMGVVRWLIHGYAPERLRLRKGKARYVVPDYPPPDTLPAAQEEITLVTERFGAKEVTPEAEAMYRLLESPGQFDLLHIACHGLADPADIDAACLEMPGKLRSDGSMSEESVLASTVKREAQLDDGDWKPIIVLNACQSLRGGYSLKGVGGFAESFVAGGAGVIVGSSWSVGDVPALVFIEEFYKRFLDPRKPETLATAAAAARQKARTDGDATWLAYVVYGHPRAKVSIS